MQQYTGIKKCYYSLVQGENFVRHFLLLILRLYWGGTLVMIGLGKWINLDGTAEFFGSLGIPAPMVMAFLVGLFEFLGGVSLFLGWFARVFTIPLIVIFVVAYATAHADAMVAIFVQPDLFISQSPFLYLLTSLIVLCFGSGAISIDYWVEKKGFGRPL